MEELYKKYSRLVYNYLKSLCENREIAEELTQETFCTAIKEINKFKGNCEIITWLCIIAKHLYYKHSKKNINNVDIDNINDFSSMSIEDTFIFNQDRLELYKGLQKVADNEKNIIYLRLLGFSFKEIAEIVGKNETWAKVVFHRGKKELARYMKGGQNERDRK